MTKVTRLPTAAKRKVKNPVALEATGNMNFIPGASRLNTPVERVMHAATQACLKEVVVAGFDADGEFYFAGSNSDGGDALWLLAMAQKKLLEMGDS